MANFNKSTSQYVAQYVPSRARPLHHPTDNQPPQGKRNTSRPVFTSHERSLARAAWSSSSARLSRDSFLPFGACGLCLELARDPVACARGDIFCRECALANLLAQKKEIRRLEKGRERTEKEAAEERARQEAEARERAVRDFERTLAGEEATAARRDDVATDGDANGREEEPKVGSKRKFVLDAEDLDRVAESDRRRARRALDEEKVCLLLPNYRQYCHDLHSPRPTLQDPHCTHSGHHP